MMNPGMETEEQVASRLEVTKTVIAEVHKQFINPVLFISIVTSLGLNNFCLCMHSRVLICV